MNSRNILVIGSANADYVIHADIMPALGETIIGKEFEVNAGGKGLNQAVAIAKLGGNTTFLGSVGDDANGKMLLNTLKEFSVKFAGKKVTDSPTGVAVITVIGTDNFIVLNSGANDSLTPQFIKSNFKLIMEADYIVIQLEIPINTVVQICELAKNGKAKIILNPAPYKPIPKSLFSAFDYLIPNEHEAESITGICPDGEENCISAIQKLRAMGTKNVVITLGKRGCAYNDGNKIVFRPSILTKAVDTTSAGDSFIGAFTTSLANNHTISDAIDFATKVASITVSRKGAAKSIPFTYEVKELEESLERI